MQTSCSSLHARPVVCLKVYTLYHLKLADVLQAEPERASQTLLDVTVNNVRDTSAARQGQDKCLAQMLHCHVPAGAWDVFRHLATKPCRFKIWSDKVYYSLQWLVGFHTDALLAHANIMSLHPADTTACRDTRAQDD